MATRTNLLDNVDHLKRWLCSRSRSCPRPKIMATTVEVAVLRLEVSRLLQLEPIRLSSTTIWLINMAIVLSKKLFTSLPIAIIVASYYGDSWAKDTFVKFAISLSTRNAWKQSVCHASALLQLWSRIPLLMSGQIERLSNANSVMCVVRKLKIPLDYAVKFVTIMSMKRAKSLPYLVVWKKPHMTLPKRYVMPETPPLIIFRKGIFLPPPNALNAKKHAGQLNVWPACAANGVVCQPIHLVYPTFPLL